LIATAAKINAAKMEVIEAGMRRTIDELLAEAQARLRRLTPLEALEASADGRMLVDIRGAEQVAVDGEIPNALWIPRNALEWRVDPASGHQHALLAGRENDIVLVCAEGYQSVLAAVTLHELGFTGVTDVIGGFSAWRAAGLPVRPADAPATGA
jgi:rhodanese-related sulfurtransferase